ncbi:tryptophan-rich sensory protein [Hymenobacter taeanensis]|uniref:Tryptophan-rich sensory protein n=1 Tax=Hymenobacter taeanensis TaxID=2735321 RepID=A0A6M6BJF1_9BACT|nr:MULTISPECIES: tryptophan-rich sensory protein [Hymenobacter]QJX47195.1 tryptophan-rich sensory protein [Hymenobacter taeanensis]UOQ81111.1 tryptophan-rich sensory protein [Hymenobacter sp. 5414T-23]
MPAPLEPAFDALTAPTTSRAWRWAATAAIIGNIALNYVSQRFPFNGQTNAQVSYKYPTPLTPAGYAFSIWGLIFLSLLAYAIWQLRPAQRRNLLPDAVARPLVWANLLTGLWLVVFAYELLVPSMLVMLGILASLAVVYGRARQLVRRADAPWYSSIPFGLYLGWISVATVVNVTLALGTKWQPDAELSLQLAIVLVGITAGLALSVTWRFAELAYPAAVAWGLLGIYVARRPSPDTEVLAIMALAAAVLVAVLGLGLTWWGSRRTSNAGH